MNETPKLLETYRGRVSASECDHLGSMNAQFYVAKISDASATMNSAIGLKTDHIRTQRRTLVNIYQEISYLAELQAGDLIVIHSGVLDVKGKKIAFLHRMTRVEDGKPVMSAKVHMVGMDLNLRTPIALEDAILVRAKQLIVDGDTL